DRGLAGAYNGHVLRELAKSVDEHASTDEFAVIVVGRIGYEYCRRLGLPIIKSVLGLDDEPTYHDTLSLTRETVQMYIDGEIDELKIIYSHYVSAISQEVKLETILPIEPVEDEVDSSAKGLYEYEPDENEILETLLPQYAESLIFGALIDSKAS